MNIVEQNWEQILNKMKLEYCSSNISYTTWIAPLTVYEVKDDTVYILVKLRASLEHIEEKYLLPFKVCIAEVTGIEYNVAFVTDSEAVIQEKKENEIKKKRANAVFEKANLNPKYTFDTLRGRAGTTTSPTRPPCRGGIPGRDLQSSLYLWRRGTRKDASDALRRPLHP